MIKHYFFAILIFLLTWACKEAPKTAPHKTETASAGKEIVSAPAYPGLLQKVFEAHGGLPAWKSKKSMVFTVTKPKGDKEVHRINLYSRKDRVDGKDFSMGFDGNQVWLLDENEQYDGDPVFYHNLIFYFYAMPFILGDNGIVYGETEDLSFEGKNYPGIHISYDSGVGTTPKDEYFLHFDPDTYQMNWLGYTVTYRTGEKSDNVKWIRYPNWEDHSGIVLPKMMTWYTYEGRTIKEPGNTISFSDVVLSEEVLSAALFAQPEGSKIVEGKQP